MAAMEKSGVEYNEYNNEYGASGTPIEHMTAGRYLATRFSSLKPPMAKVPNPFKALRLLTKSNWLNFLIGFLGWTWDAVDFFTVSLTVGNLAKTFGKTNTDIT